MILLMRIGIVLMMFELIALLIIGILLFTFGFFDSHSVASSWIG